MPSVRTKPRARCPRRLARVCGRGRVPASRVSRRSRAGLAVGIGKATDKQNGAAHLLADQDQFSRSAHRRGRVPERPRVAFDDLPARIVGGPAVHGRRTLGV